MTKGRLVALVAALVVVALGVLAVTRTDPRRPTGSVRVADANLAGWAIYAGAPAAGTDLATTIRAHQLDVVGVEEVCATQLDRTAQRVPGSRTVFQRTVPRDQPLPWSPPEDRCVLGIGLVVGPGVEVLRTSSIELPTADGPSGGPDAEEDRYGLCARVSTDRTGSFLVCTTHLTHLLATPDTRRRQAAALLAFASSQRVDDEPVVLMGDLNARLGSDDLSPIAAAGWPPTSARWARAHVLHLFVSPDSWQVGRTASREFGRTDHPLLWTDLRPQT